MVREGGMLEKKIAQAGGDPAALADMREALDDAYMHMKLHTWMH